MTNVLRISQENGSLKKGEWRNVTEENVQENLDDLEPDDGEVGKIKRKVT